jgi:hypothetical protein
VGELEEATGVDFRAVELVRAGAVIDEQDVAVVGGEVGEMKYRLSETLVPQVSSPIRTRVTGST